MTFLSYTATAIQFRKTGILHLVANSRLGKPAAGRDKWLATWFRTSSAIVMPEPAGISTHAAR
jgi:hypothetical protein